MRDEQILRAWLTAHGAMITRIAGTYERRPALVAELSQDIALALWRALPSYRADAAERTFIARIAHNVGISHVRKAVGRPPGTPIDDAPPLPDAAPTPELMTHYDQQRAALQTAVRALPLTYRAVIALHLEGFTNKDIAQTLSLSPSNVGVRLSRAKDMLKKTLEDHHE